MNERIKEIRKYFKMTQVKFARSISIAQNTLSQYEKGISTPLDAIIASICKVYNVDEHWLRTGEGEMFVNKEKKELLADFFADVLADNESFKLQLLSAIATFDADDWAALEKITKKIVKESEARAKFTQEEKDHE
ncbi:Helix-turn-helix domain-containing protein [Acetitomaculum ruminis DSM 5522]|uniref:Helix-turn-helix domain-containing protein n=1 Tax=Acetitomaculum ruminis DSM 5522 TaxID=1120918 RepID=A0A1I0WH34_9FIRM|nr:helix-turn-helix transcriptional regulator [Acetitomaculum ruminis]SFA88085.1 Helix-turn-helix domain-containing protein [Acetitomaculum ruminis DSM 5522]